MTADELIDSYVAELAGFGRPADVAARYGSPVTLIDPADTRRFLTLAMAGTALIPFGAILNALTDQQGSRRDLGQAIEKAWPIVFAWLGLLVVGFAVAAWARRRRPDAGWQPRPMPTDRISRPARAAAIIFFALGTLALTDPAWLIRTVSGGRAAPAAYAAFAYDEGFLRLRGPVVLGLMIAGLIMLATLLWHGRWRPWIRQADRVHSLAIVHRAHLGGRSRPAATTSGKPWSSADRATAPLVRYPTKISCSLL